MCAWSAYAAIPLRPKRSRCSSERRSSFSGRSDERPAFAACARSLSRLSPGVHFAAAGTSPGIRAPAFSASARADSFTRAASRISPSILSGSKSTFVMVVKSARTVKTPMERSRAPCPAARCAYQPIPLAAWMSRSWSAAVSGFLPQTPCTVHPDPFAVCSHW